MIDYEYYSEVYYGEKLEDGKTFKRLARKAEQLVNQRTYGKSRSAVDIDVQDMIKFTICELVDNFYEVDELGGVSSERTGDYQVSFSEKGVERLLVSQNKIIRDNLSSTGLLPTNSIFKSLGRW